MKVLMKISIALICIFMYSLLTSCQKDEPVAPIITTSHISVIKQSTAICGGEIISDGGTEITDRGVCWSIDSIPTISDNRTHDSIGTGSFSSKITGLDAGTKYHVRAYATNIAGTGYGEGQTFRTLSDPAQVEEEMIQNYLINNPDLDFQKQSSGLYYLEVLAGTGPAPSTNDSVYVFYTGKFLDGTIFGSNVPSGILYGFRANIGENIPGFDQGVMLMKEGGKATIILPSVLGYGTVGVPWIPGYTPILFDIELVRVVKK
jgi:hypothetical protein